MTVSNDIHKGNRPPRWGRRLINRLIFVTLVAIGGMYMLSFSAARPENLGAIDGKLADCPSSPNCVSTQTTSSEHRMEPLLFEGSVAEATEKIKNVVKKTFPRARLVDQREGYLHFEFVSFLFRFVDDVEFVLNDSTKEIHFRSASRVGHSDLGVNRRRMSKLTQELKP